MASEVGYIEWGGSGSYDIGGYNNLFFEIGFFCYDGGSWDFEYGLFFLFWYLSEFVNYGDWMFEMTKRVFDKRGVTFVIKCVGVYWWYNVCLYVVEFIVGYFNICVGEFVFECDGYVLIVRVCKKYGVRLNFTCVEMYDSDYLWYCYCGFEGLLC